MKSCPEEDLEIVAELRESRAARYRINEVDWASIMKIIDNYRVQRSGKIIKTSDISLKLLCGWRTRELHGPAFPNFMVDEKAITCVYPPWRLIERDRPTDLR
jgi:hypothetical protein